jgi:4-hydroxy-tetrahydrodipicolinate synthase
MLDTSANGVFVIAVTPFTERGAIDSASVDRMVDFYRGCGVAGITVLGMMGEAPKLTHAESVAQTQRVVQRENVLGPDPIPGCSPPAAA